MVRRRLVAVFALLTLTLFVAGCYTQVGRPKLKTEADVDNEQYFEDENEDYAEEYLEQRENEPDSVIYHRYDVYHHYVPPAYDPYWMGYGWMDPYLFAYDPYWYPDYYRVPSYYMSFWVSWGDPWWPYWSYPYAGPLSYWRPFSYYGGWAYYSYPYYSYYDWYDYERVPPPKRRNFLRRHQPPLMGAGRVAVGSSASGRAGTATLAKTRPIDRRSTVGQTGQRTPTTLSKRREATARTKRRIERTDRELARRSASSGTYQSPRRVSKSVEKSKPARRANVSRATERRRTSVSRASTSRRKAVSSRPRTRRTAPRVLKPATPKTTKKSSSSSSTRKPRRSNYYVAPRPTYRAPSSSGSSWSRGSSGSTYSRPTISRRSSPPPSRSSSSSSSRSARRRER